MASGRATELLADVWALLGGDPAELARLELSGPADTLPSTLQVTATASAAVAASLLAASETSGADAALDTRQVAVAIRSEHHLLRDGASMGDPLDPLSAFYPTADGWLRLHGNYPWHRDAALRVLGCGPAHAEVAAAVLRWPDRELEDALHAAGGVASAVRSEPQWRESEQAQAAAELPLLEVRQIGDAAPRAPRRPRVLDLTRVIAGPVATRTLAVHGADVLRIDAPDRPESPLLFADTAPGKRSATLDLETTTGRQALDELLAGADAVALGHRPGALDRFGLSAPELARRHPGVVVLVLSAWGHTGPWAGRRGFDSLVQAATGISMAESVDGRTPGVLPAQLLDHASGCLAAAGVLRAVTEQRRIGGSWLVRLSLAQTAHWLVGLGRRPAPDVDALDPAPYVEQLGRLSIASPPGRLGGRPLHWPAPPPGFGADSAAWTRP